MNEKKWNKLRVLVVDDEATMIHTIVWTLKTLGIEHIKAMKNVTDAIKYLDAQTKFPFDLIISDWDMPNLSGLDFLVYTRKKFSNAPFLMLTGNVVKEDILKAKNAGVSGYIAKPFNADGLEAKINVSLKKHK